jgi:hypothetical protein
MTKSIGFIKICHNKCRVGNLNHFDDDVPGIPQLKISSVDPMVIPKVSLLQGSGPVSIDSTFTNLHVNGITDFDIKRVT